MATILALVVCTALALTFSSTRGMGILGTGILILIFPAVTIVAIALAGIAYFIYHRKGA